MRRSIVTCIRDAIEVLALCHNVTPVYDANVADALNKPVDQMTEELKNNKFHIKPQVPTKKTKNTIRLI